MVNSRVVLVALVCVTLSLRSTLAFQTSFSGRIGEAGLRLVAKSGCRIPHTVTPPARAKAVGALALRAELISNFKSSVKQLHKVEEFHTLKQENRLVFVKLAASHCRKCFAVASKFIAVADQYEEHSDIEFATVHLDKVRGMAQETGVKKTPTFHVYMDGEKVDELVGSEDVAVVAAKIKNLVEEWKNRIEGTPTAVDQVIDSYTPSEGEQASKSQDSSVSVSVSEETVDAPDGGEGCGEDGCEISWD